METNNVTQWVIIGAAVIVLIVGGAWLAMRGKSGSSETALDTATTTASSTMPTSSVSADKNVPKGSVTATSDGEIVMVSSQAAGTHVKVSQMQLTRATWVAVRDDMSILGAAWFPSSATGGEIELQRATVSGKSYRVVLYADDGDKKFDFKKDQLIESNGAPIGVSFDAQ